MKKPIIGITCNYTYDDKTPCQEGIGARGQQWQLLADDYITSVALAGGIPLLIPALDNPEPALAALDIIDGLLLSGGNDLNPNLYQEHPHSNLGGISPKRDITELELFKKAFEQLKLPILGICRGTQVINVALGGSLEQHIPSNYQESHSLFMFPRELEAHRITIDQDSLLYPILGKDAGVNSFHHQAVKEVAPGLKVSAKSPAGIVEAIELKEKGFLLGVQWHPEMMAAQSPKQLQIIKLLIEAAKK